MDAAFTTITTVSKMRTASLSLALLLLRLSSIQSFQLIIGRDFRSFEVLASSEPEASWESRSAELVGDDDDDDWVPDRVRANAPYTPEEQDVISAMGGQAKRTRQEGYLGDSTLEEICRDYSVPICYLADVLASWGVPIPINPKNMLGDLVTGEQAFAVLEAVNSLDVAELHDRYSDVTLETLCLEWDIALSDAFQLAMKEGWNLPFGVQTFLRTDQERELLRVLVDPDSIAMDPYGPESSYD